MQDSENIHETEDKDVKEEAINSITYKNSEYLRDLIVTPLQRAQNLDETIRQFKFIIPKAVAEPVDFVPSQIVT